ncbi:MAG: Ig-like domain-containing protein [Pseudomonadota bacterium]
MVLNLGVPTAIDGFVANSEAVAADDDFSADQNTTITGNLFADNGNGEDIDPDRDSFNVFSVAEINRGNDPQFLNSSVAASLGTFAVDANGNFTFDPSQSVNALGLREGEIATQTFFYRVVEDGRDPAPLLTAQDGSNGAFGGVTGRVTFTITGRNDVPVDGNEVLNFTADDLTDLNTLSVRVNLLENATDVDRGDVLILDQAIGLTDPSIGQVFFNVDRASGNFQWDYIGDLSELYTDENVSVRYSYGVLDGNGGRNGSALTITITGTNNRAAAADDIFTIDAGDTATGNVLTDNGNGADIDIDGDTLTVYQVADANRPDNADFLAPVGGAVALGRLTVRADGSFSLDTSGNSEAIALGAGESATQDFFYRITDLAEGEEPAIGARNPLAEQDGSDSIGLVRITINGVNDGPIAANDAIMTDEDSAQSGNVLLDNGSGADRDPDTNDILSVGEVNGVAALVDTQFTLSSGALLTLNGDGTFDYDPNGAFEGLTENETATDTFSYTLVDGNGGFDQATVTLTINGINDRPEALPDMVSTAEDAVLTGNLFSDNGNGADTDSEGDAITVFSVAEINRDDDQAFIGPLGQVAAFGILQVDADGDFVFDPTANPVANALGDGEILTQTFLYRVTDEDTPSEPLLVGADVARDMAGDTIGRLDITITGVNDAPIAVNDFGITGEDGPSVSFNLTDNDSDVDNNDDPEISSIDTTGTLGLVTINPDNDSVSYDPNGAFEALGAGETTTDTFTYTINDGNGGLATATVTVEIIGENDAPMDEDEAVSVDEDGPVLTVNLLDNATDLDAGAMLFIDGDFSAVTPGGTATVQPSGTFTFDPGTDFNSLRDGQTATLVFDYTVSDNNGGRDPSSITVTVNGTNDAPMAFNDTGTTNENEAIRLDVLINDTDPDTGLDPTLASSTAPIGDTLSVARIEGVDVMVGDSVTIASGARVTLLADGTLDYDPNGGLDNLRFGESTIDRFTYTAVDDFGALSAASVAVTVAGRGTSVPDTLRDTVTEMNSRPGGPAGMGTDNDDAIGGGTRADVIFGRDGDDRIVANGGNDTVLGDAGDDTLVGGSGRDVLLGGDDNDRVDGGGGADILLGGAGNDTIQGRGGADDTDDGAGHDRVIAGGGNDTIFLNMGNDVINLGGGADLVVAEERGFGRDTINDFRPGQGDQLDLRLLGIDSASDARAIGTQSGNFAVLNFGDGDILRLRGIDLEDLTNADFVGDSLSMMVSFSGGAAVTEDANLETAFRFEFRPDADFFL